ncbi:MAG: hypothetical protein EOO06_17840 [Chitinophagaceae bacterium]|nr:MAG: hypothetical protein EOO06_17840 [Chitinophagaceae bacterium]
MVSFFLSSTIRPFNTSLSKKSMSIFLIVTRVFNSLERVAVTFEITMFCTKASCSSPQVKKTVNKSANRKPNFRRVVLKRYHQAATHPTNRRMTTAICQEGKAYNNIQAKRHQKTRAREPHFNMLRNFCRENFYKM